MAAREPGNDHEPPTDTVAGGGTGGTVPDLVLNRATLSLVPLARLA